MKIKPAGTQGGPARRERILRNRTYTAEKLRGAAVMYGPSLVLDAFEGASVLATASKLAVERSHQKLEVTEMGQLVPSLVFYLFVLVLCLARPGAGRIFLGIFFLIMAVGVNVVIALLSPDLFVGLGANAPLVPAYGWFFENVVATAPPLFGLFAAAYEITIGLMMLSGGRYARWGLIGGIVFLVGTTPLGVWTLANPVLALALAVLLGGEYGRSLPEIVGGAVRRLRSHAPATVAGRRVRR